MIQNFDCVLTKFDLRLFTDNIGYLKSILYSALNYNDKGVALISYGEEVSIRYRERAPQKSLVDDRKGVSCWENLLI